MTIAHRQIALSMRGTGTRMEGSDDRRLSNAQESRILKEVKSKLFHGVSGEELSTMNPLPQDNNQANRPLNHQVNPNFNRSFNASFQTIGRGERSATSLGNGVRKVVWLLLFAWLLGAIGLGWLVKFSLILVGLVIGVPIVGFFVLKWWLTKNVVEGDCPVCGAELTGIKGTQIPCNNCGEPLQVGAGAFTRSVQDGTIDVTAVDVLDVTAVDVNAQSVD